MYQWLNAQLKQFRDCAIAFRLATSAPSLCRNGVALLPLFAPWSGVPRPLYALFAGRKGMSAIARYFMDELTTRLANGV
ncbi:LysR family transcriptional regulator [Shigella flexneri]